MVRTHKRSLPGNELDGPGRAARRRKQHRALSILLLIILLGLFLLGFNRVAAYEDDVVRSTFTLQSTVPVLVMSPARGETGLVAIVAHGFTGSKNLMSGMGVELAHAGITAYLFDFPGHGDSPLPMASNNDMQRINQANMSTLSKVVDYARTHNKASHHPNIVLIGHSMGSVAVGDYAMAHTNDNDIISTILISPTGQEQPDQSHPKNLLLLAGQNDLPSVISNSKRLLLSGCDLSSSQSAPMGCGNPANGTGRRAMLLPNLNNITILNGDSTSQEMLNWLHRVEPKAVNANDTHPDIRNFWMLLGIAAILLSMLPLSALIVTIFELNPAPHPQRGRDVIIFDLCLLVGIALAITILSFWQPFSFLHILLANYVSGYFLLVAIVTALLAFLIRRRLPIPSFHQTSRQIVVGVLLAAFLYFTLGQLVTFSWQDFAFTMPRLWRFLVIAVLILPVFLLDEGINRGYQELGVVRSALASLAFKALLIGGLLVLISVRSDLDFLSLTLPMLILLFLILVSFCVQLYTNGRAALTGALLSTLIISWFLSTTFPIT